MTESIKRDEAIRRLTAPKRPLRPTRSSSLTGCGGCTTDPPLLLTPQWS